jgi:hypothetical protein
VRLDLQRPQPGRLARVAVSESFIAGLPKAELHVHHVGSVPLRAVAELAARHPGTVPSDPDELAQFFIFDDFPHFIRNYLAVVDLIKTAEDVRLITYEVAADMASQNIRYAELTVTPYISQSPTNCRPKRSWRRSRMPGRAQFVIMVLSCSGSSIFRQTSACQPPS